MFKKLIKRAIPKGLKTKIKSALQKQFAFLNVTRPYQINLIDHGRFKDQVAVVTGGSGVIGRAICSRLALEGATVYVCGMTKYKMDSVIHEIRELGGTAFACNLDVTNEKNIRKVFEYVVKKHAKLDILVTSAGGSARQKKAILPDQEIDVIDDVLNINLRGTILCVREAAKQMIKNKSGKIIMLGSTIGCKGKVEFSDYAAAKAGIIRFSESVAMELGRYGINVNCVSPGIVKRDSISVTEMESLKKTNYLNSYGKPEDISNIVAFLASEEASFITGQNFVVDGGRSLGLKGD